MFSTDPLLKEVNIFAKTISLFFILIALIIIKSPIFLIFVNLFFLLITKPFPILSKINLISIIINLFGMPFPKMLWVTKILVLGIYTNLWKKITKTLELRFLLEKTLYRFQSRKITYQILSIIYFGKYFINNFKKMFHLKGDYQLRINIKLISFFFRQSYYKTKEEMQEFIEIYQLRFYNDSKDRTYIEKTNWESWDTNYVVIHGIILLLSFFYGR